MYEIILIIFSWIEKNRSQIQIKSNCEKNMKRRTSSQRMSKMLTKVATKNAIPEKVRVSRWETFCKKGVLKNFAKFTGKHLYRSLFFNKVLGLSLQLY